MVKKSRSNKGFTMAELLIVVAIIAVLVAIAIPVFTSQLKNARLAVDHSAMRDAYAVVQVANNTHEVVIDGEAKTFEELDIEASSYSFLTFYLSKDCSSLIHGYPWAPDSVYIFQEDGADSSGVCQTCGQWDRGNASQHILQPSRAHSEGSAIPVTYVAETHQLYLGWGV